jgi:hypothetical protein
MELAGRIPLHLPFDPANQPGSGCIRAQMDYILSTETVEEIMKTKTEIAADQPKPFTTGVTIAMVRQHAYELFRDKLPDHPLTLDDWVMAEKDLVGNLQAENRF